MTYRDWFIQTCKRFELSEEDVDLILINQSAFIPDVTADVDVKKAKIALCKEFASLIPLYNLSEGGFSLSWNMEAITQWYNFTSREVDIKNALKPYVTAHNNLW